MLCVIYVFEYSHTHAIKYIGTHQELEVKQLKVRQGSHQPPLAHLQKQHVDSQPQTYPQVSMPTIIIDTLLFKLKLIFSYCV
jgi:hypothetical protein